MIRWLRNLLLLLACLLAHAEAELRVGVEPYFSPQLLVTTLQPMASALEKSIGRPVTLLTAPDYRQFILRIEKQEFDLVVIGPHTARYAQQQAGYLPMLIGRTKLVALIAVKRDSSIQKADQLAGATVALPDALTATAMLGEEWLHKQGVNAQYHYYPFYNAAAMAVQHGDAQTAVLNKTALTHMPAAVRDDMRILAETRGLPNIVLLANSHLDPTLRQHYADTLATLMNSPDHGASFAGKLGFAGVDPIKPGDLDGIEPFLAELQRRLKAPQ